MVQGVAARFLLATAFSIHFHKLDAREEISNVVIVPFAVYLDPSFCAYIRVSWFCSARCADGVVVGADGARKAETRWQQFPVLRDQDERPSD